MKTYSRAAEPATAGFSRYAERVAAAGGSDGHAKGSQVGGGGHAALVCFFFMSAIFSLLSHLLREWKNSPSGLKHSQLRSLAPRSFALLGKTHASPKVTLRYRGAAKAAKTAVLTVMPFVRVAEQELLDGAKVRDMALQVDVLMMMFAAPTERNSIVSRSMVMKIRKRATAIFLWM